MTISGTRTTTTRTRPAAGKRTGYHHGDLRRALLEASLDLVDESGIGALSLREVARKAGVSHNAPYHHFKDRGSLLSALAEEGFAELAAEMAAARAAAPDARARLEACGLAYVRFALKSAARFKVMFRPELGAPSEGGAVARASTPALDTLIAAIVEAQQAGLAPSGDPMPLVLTCWAAVHGLASLWLDGPLARTQRAFGASSPDKLAAIVSSTLAALLIGSAAAQATKGRRRDRAQVAR
jgi:AcrR family transcriptional regulator